MKYAIARPIDGVTINGNEYLLDEDRDVMKFDTRKECLEFITENVTSDDPEDYIWELEGGE